jgi:proteasome lid subunit RPN8/RPN11
VPAEVRRALVEHAEAELPNEACGLMVIEADAVARYEPARNVSPSPYFFELEFDPVRWMDLWDEGYEIGIFHSHVSSEPRPSKTDVENIGQWQGRPYFILNVRTGELAGWRILDGGIEPLPLS